MAETVGTLPPTTTTAPRIAGGLSPERRIARERARQRARWSKRALLVAAAIALVLGAVSALRPRPVPVEVVTAARGPMSVAVDEPGRTRVRDRFVVSAPVTGTLSRITLQPGDPVQAGQVLATVGPLVPLPLDARSRAEAQAAVAAAMAAERQARASVERARVAHQKAGADAERARRLGASDAMSRSSVEQAEFEERLRAEELRSAELGVRVAAEETRRARAVLEAGRRPKTLPATVAVRSPSGGRILRVAQQSEAVVQAGAPLVEIGDPDSLEVIVDVLSTDAVRIRPGAPATIERWGDAAPLAARVDRVEPSAFTQLSALGVEEQRVNVILSFTSPRERWAALGDGFRVEARIVVWRDDQVIAVPASAVFRHDAGWAVFRVEGNRARLQPVTIGERSATEVQITAGVVPGVEVLRYPGDRVADGVRVAAGP